MEKKTIGSEEWCTFPDLNIPAIKARIDSGAKTSALHAFNIHLTHRGDISWVRFDVHPIQGNRRIIVTCESPLLDKRRIKSTSGVSETRYVIRQTLKIGEEQWPVELTLTNRDSMGYRMILGREAMEGRFLIDPAGSLLLGAMEDQNPEKFYDSPVNRGLRVALLASDPMLYSNRRLVEAAIERGHEISFLNIKHCYMKLDSHRPEVHYRGRQALETLDAVIPRIRPSITFYGCAVTRQFESMGVFCLNNSISIGRSRDKLQASQLLSGAGLAIPTTGFANSPEDTDDLINMVGGAPLVVKLLEGTQGKGVVLTETRTAAESVITAFKSLQANILVQEYIKESSGEDLRCFVINGRVVASIKRTAAAGRSGPTSTAADRPRRSSSRRKRKNLPWRPRKPWASMWQGWT